MAENLNDRSTHEVDNEQLSDSLKQKLLSELNALLSDPFVPEPLKEALLDGLRESSQELQNS